MLRLEKLRRSIRSLRGVTITEAIPGSAGHESSFGVRSSDEKWDLTGWAGECDKSANGWPVQQGVSTQRLTR